MSKEHFTGAVRDKKGKFELADGGTLLLDEISELGFELQAKLLRVIQERLVEPVGAEQTIGVDVRLLAATNVNLKERVAAGQFREDLFYRLNVIPVQVPSLRERIEDVPLLIHEFLVRFAPGREIEVADSLMTRLREHSWPGNIRELENLMERMVILRKSDRLTVDDLPLEFAEPAANSTADPQADLGFHEAERRLILNALEKCRWNKSKAAAYLKVPRHILIYRMKKYEIKGY